MSFGSINYAIVELTIHQLLHFLNSFVNNNSWIQTCYF